MSQPDEVEPIAWAVVAKDGEYWDAAPLLVKEYADRRAATLNRTHGDSGRTPFRVAPLYSESAYLALVARVEAAEGALADAVDMLTDREVVPVMLDENAIVRIQRMRDALRASGTREGA